jgi:hypothetical protein
MDNLPIELIIYIIKNYLNVNDLMNLRLVSKKFKLLSEDKSIRINELIINNKVNEFKSSWFLIDKLINYKDAIKYSLFLSLKSIYNLENNLRSLHFNCINSSDLNFYQLNKLVNLNQLELIIRCKLEKDDNHELKLNELRILKISYYNEDYGINAIDKSIIQLNTTNLIYLKCYELISISIVNLNQIKYLETDFYNHNQMIHLKNSLEFYQCNRFPNLNQDFLYLYPNLKKLSCNLDFSYFGDQEYSELIDTIKFIVNKKTQLKRNDLRIYFQGVEILSQDKIDDFDNGNPTRLSFQLANYNYLDDKLTSVYDCYYNELMRSITTLPNNFFQKYFKIKYVYCNEKIEGHGNHFFWFLSNLKQLKFLSLNNTSLNQSIYDKLPDACQLTYLLINENNLILNYDFILNFRILEHFETNQQFLQSTDLAIKSFEKLKYLNYFQFANHNGAVIIQKIFNDRYTLNCDVIELNCDTFHFEMEFKLDELIEHLPNLIYPN